MTNFRSFAQAILLTLCAISISAQGFQPPASLAEDRAKAFQTREAMKLTSPVNNIPFSNVGPSVMSGRVVDIEVNPEDPTIFYVAYASGGLWKTTNNGTSFTPIFDNEAVITIGDIDIHWETGTIYVGTGEVNSSRSSYAGLGMYVSMDDGATWKNIGLQDSHHIGKVIVSDSDPKEVIVGVLGHLYSDNKERGIYKSTDGGETWLNTLYINAKTGIVDIERDPYNPDILYAASWERERRAWNFIEAGEGSAIYKSEDNGESWKLISNGKNGFPSGKGVGRIGLSVYNVDGESKVYALLDNYNRRPKEDTDVQEELTKDDLRVMSKEEFVALDTEKLETFLREYRFPRKYKAKGIIRMVKNEEILPHELLEYLEDANALLFETSVIGAEVYVTSNEGLTWNKTHDDYIEYLYNSYGYYFGMIEVSPTNSNEVYIAGVPILKSEDGGKSWSNINKENVHVDHHALWINPKREGHLINGNDGGVNISYDKGENWLKCNSPAVGQFYYVNVDEKDPYNIFGGAQDNGVWYGPSSYTASKRWHSSGQYPYKSIVGGDGMQVQIDSRNNDLVYAGLQFGNYYRINIKSGDRERITPRHDLGQRPFRWNWQSPILLSSHNQDVIYMGSNHLHRSLDQGRTFKTISKDLSNGGQKGDVSYGTLSSISESPFTFGLIYTGSDDGVIQVSKDGGYSWERISNKLPQNMWVSRVQASSHVESRVYASLNGYRWDDFTPYLYSSDDYGTTWKRLGKQLPHEAINVVKEDPVDADVLYVGTDHALYVSFDRGLTFHIMSKDLPAVPIHDLVIQNKAKEIVLGTHGRSFYKASVLEIQSFNKIQNELVHLFPLDDVRASSRWGRKPSIFNQDTDPKYEFSIYSKSARNASFEVKNKEGDILKKFNKEIPAGISIQSYDLSIDLTNARRFKDKTYEELDAAENGKHYLKKGKYILVAEVNGTRSEQEMEVK